MHIISRIFTLYFLVYFIFFTTSYAQPLTKILLLGDSIIAGYGVPKEKSLPHQMQQLFNQTTKNIQVINGGISGDTTTGGKNRLSWMVQKHNPDIIFIALGGNDALRGIAPHIVKKNLHDMLDILAQHPVTTILSAVTAPTNLGITYSKTFNNTYKELAKDFNVALYPFLLEKTFTHPQLMLSDGIHPNAEGIKIIANDLVHYLSRTIMTLPSKNNPTQEN